MIDEIKNELIKNFDENYKNFSSKLTPNTNNIIGIRLPILRKMAKKIAKNNYQEFISKNDHEYMELTMLEGMVIGEINLDFNKKLNYIKNFIPKINNWLVCDSFCSGLKIIKNNKEKTKNFIDKYFNSNEEFELRFAFVITLNYFIDDIDYIFAKILKFKNEKYYAKMAVAWLLSYCFIYHFEKTEKFILNNKIHKWVLQKGITKGIESLKLNSSQKDRLKNLRNLL